MELPLIAADVRDRAALARTFSTHAIDAVVHCAGLKAVGEGEAQPLAYYDNNVGGSIALAQAMTAAGVKTLVFSSSATVYGQPERNPVAEDAPLKPASVYGRTKRTDRADSRGSRGGRRVVAHRPAALFQSRRRRSIRRDRRGAFERAEQPASRFWPTWPAGRRPCVDVFGDDYADRRRHGRARLHTTSPTFAAGRVAALAHLARQSGVVTLNLGMGRGCSVLEVIAAFERACGKPLARRSGAAPAGRHCELLRRSRARQHGSLGWRASCDLDAICADAWRWQVRGGRLPAGRSCIAAPLARVASSECGRSRASGL